MGIRIARWNVVKQNPRQWELSDENAIYDTMRSGRRWRDGPLILPHGSGRSIGPLLGEHAAVEISIERGPLPRLLALDPFGDSSL